jgi:ribosomal protein S18 acetylase RimI-like enzyme
MRPQQSLRLLDHILSADTTDTIADVNLAAFVQAHGHLLSANALIKCSTEVFREDWKRFPNPKCAYGFAYRNDELVGFTALGPCRHEGLESHGEVYSLYVHPTYQHRGIGGALLRWGIERIRDKSNGKVYVAVVAGNSARHFYLRAGAKHVVSHERDVFGDMLRTDVLCYEI